MQPAMKLDVPLMDGDHAVIEAMFERVETTDDADLAALLAEIDAEVIAHFAREEVLIDAREVPVANCHKAQHRILLGEFARARTATDGGDLRRWLAVLAELVAGHVGSVDRVTAQFLGGTLSPADVARLRLPTDHC
jgi:hemerythrin-like metal-binding protein